MTITTATLTSRAHDGVVTREDPAAKPTRRRFSAAYKLAILQEYERCSDSGEKGALLRREGLYSSHIVEWRRAKEVGALAGLAPKVRRSTRSAEHAEIDRLRPRNEKLEAQLVACQAQAGARDPGKSIGALGEAAGREHRGDDPAAREARAVIEDCFCQIEPLLGARAACTAVGRSRATHYRRQRPGRVTPRRARPSPANKLSGGEVQAVLDVLRSARFADDSPAQAFYTLLDEGTYLASESTFYRILCQHGEVRERRRQATHPAKKKPELVARGPNQCWSWVKGPETPSHRLDQPVWSRRGCSPWCSPSSSAWSIAPLERSSWRGGTPSPRTPRSSCCATRWRSFVAKSAAPASPGRTGH